MLFGSEEDKFVDSSIAGGDGGGNSFESWPDVKLFVLKCQKKES